ncbi:bifunctional DNA-formamidopyrimidine glycosylase/DNA-(apurinic or apyrimidinic site) lyase [Breoghania sp.]|uniref:bifunctional DNA-formamidopyrimidine glycosylase/DNA-(apurinic or apyrimidinic site) lyase n=1 Tax=Breoghania sp. TaxID=2065378 RepID=UPI00262CB325|nr:bifunctional DNA-formamidopyrimidine glycosylase/DNA-(apurinic or apyrimidinic site) lyase [Breoghania sp.]MDJ0930900.1 bifunctional DNA-formamidopyrimidine glycosylase/DNA-(apurinic or apyrimidinic site) lyase [Breoghania sp.]
MPELPEVETVRRGLAPVMEGARIVSLEQRRPNLRFPFPDRFSERLQGQRIEVLSRRAKYLLADIRSGDILVMHLGMSGSFRILEECDGKIAGDFYYARNKDTHHDHVFFHLETAGGALAQVIYNDPRRFGFMTLIERAGLSDHPFFARLGLEPLGNELDGAWLAHAFAGRKTPLKAALLDQKLIAGLGNIYVCEALWRAKLSPLRLAGTLVTKAGRPTAAAGRLTEAIREVLAQAVEAGGSTLRDYMKTDGTLGYFQHSFIAYDREGEPCRHPDCNGTIERITQSGRSTFYCRSCQR